MENAITLIAEALTGKNKIIKAKPNSVFEYIDLCQGDNDKIQDIARDVSEKLGNEVNLIKTKLLPLMKEIDTLIKDKLATYTKDTDSSKYKIIEFDIPVVVNTLKSVGAIGKHRDPNKLQDEVLNIPAVSKLDLPKYLELETAAATSALHVELGKLSDEDILKLWEDYLGNVSSSNNNLNILFTDPVGNISTLIILFTITHNLLKNKPSEVTANDDKFFGIVKYLHDEIGNYIALAEHIFSTGREKGRLIIGYSQDGYTIRVDEKIYQTFIDEGNTPEVILGLASNNLKNDVEYIFYDKIVANKEILLESWNKKLKIEHYTESIKNVSTHKAVYSIALEEIYNLVPQDLQPLLTVNLDQAREKLDYKLNTEKDSEIVDPTYMAREIVGYVLFEQTSFHKFTHYMIEIEKMNPEFDCKEIANFATVEMLLNYLTDQITLESN